jgi:hypothetical protein
LPDSALTAQLADSLDEVAGAVAPSNIADAAVVLTGSFPPNLVFPSSMYGPVSPASQKPRADNQLKVMMEKPS